LGASEFDIEEQLDFVEKAQACTTAAKAKKERVDYEVIDNFSPFLADEDLAKQKKWCQDPNMQIDILELLETLGGDAMDKVMSDAYHRSQLEELQRYKEIGCNFDRVHTTWQIHKLDC
jgi:hypothetical protein